MSEPIDVTPLPIDSTQRLLIILCHASVFLGVGVLFPLIVFLATKSDNNAVTKTAAEAFNFQLSFVIWGILCVPLFFIGIGAFLAMLLGLATIVLAIIAIVKAANDEFYDYPLKIRFLKR